jgi:hypothetical protein
MLDNNNNISYIIHCNYIISYLTTKKGARKMYELVLRDKKKRIRETFILNDLDYLYSVIVFFACEKLYYHGCLSSNINNSVLLVY